MGRGWSAPRSLLPVDWVLSPEGDSVLAAVRFWSDERRRPPRRPRRDDPRRCGGLVLSPEGVVWVAAGWFPVSFGCSARACLRSLAGCRWPVSCPDEARLAGRRLPDGACLRRLLPRVSLPPRLCWLLRGLGGFAGVGSGGSSAVPKRLPTRRLNRPGFVLLSTAGLRSCNGTGAGAIGLIDLIAGSSAVTASVEEETGISGSAGAFARL